MKKLFSIALAATMALSLAGAREILQLPQPQQLTQRQQIQQQLQLTQQRQRAESPQAATSRQEHLQSLFLMQQAVELTLVPDFLPNISPRQHRLMLLSAT